MIVKKIDRLLFGLTSLYLIIYSSFLPSFLPPFFFSVFIGYQIINHDPLTGPELCRDDLFRHNPLEKNWTIPKKQLQPHVSVQ